MKKIVVILFIVSVSALCGLAIYNKDSSYNKDSRTNGLTKVEKFRYVEPGAGTCMSISPGCGVCEGEIIDKECYIDKDKATPDQLERSGLN